mmetsp:Transcript_10898/g.16678  ORF Transcript_10898/g.16678 Transcript_10898/m.16678 type:complete len:92 (+) Transcript_10898:182-457(+)|eukprot:CAMPEP_0194238278 /NCGR_PEP_ID=MMETSP0158-20130606/5058_1 /TAXON_ID=33649 /ORGANISM="Thalassionema nitzschioides, Strain L26-B" /LENGTH=91 /DNA_ID=CAMNT_0038972491 /DNA_START=61 /DNA_END=333 /DNA_ORIENTATION=+
MSIDIGEYINDSEEEDDKDDMEVLAKRLERLESKVDRMCQKQLRDFEKLRRMMRRMMTDERVLHHHEARDYEEERARIKAALGYIEWTLLG